MRVSADDRLRPGRPRVATAMIAAASTTMPAMITKASNGGKLTTVTRPVGFTMALCMEWNSPAINTLAPPSGFSAVSAVPLLGRLAGTPMISRQPRVRSRG